MKPKRRVKVRDNPDGTKPLILHPDYEPARLNIATWELEETETGAKVKIQFGVGPEDESSGPAQ